MNALLLAVLKRHALDYLRRGWCPLPVGIDKKPAVRRWKALQASPPSEANVEGWFDREAPRGIVGDVAGVGIVLGSASGGLAVRDFDLPGAFEAWRDAYSELAATLPTVKTVRGFHIYFTAPGTKTRKFPDGEIRGEGSYVVAPPSRHQLGMVYRWVRTVGAEGVPVVDPAVFETEAVSIERGNTPTQWPECPVDHECPESPGALGPLVYGAELKERIRLAIAETVPKAVGTRNAGVFAFARRLKALPELAGRKGLELRDPARWWFDAARPTIGTKDWDTTWADFLHAWDRVRLPFGVAFAEALEAAQGADDPPCAARFEAPSTRLLIRLCRELQRRAGEGAFFLDARSAGKALGIDKGSALKRLGMLATEGVLALVKKGHTGRASEYRYLVE